MTLDTAVCGLEGPVNVQLGAAFSFPRVSTLNISGLLVPVPLPLLDMLAGLETFFFVAFRK